MKKQDNTRVFNLQDVNYTDLDGKQVNINFDQKDFANALFAQAQSIDMDEFARGIHKHGKAEVSEVIEQELIAVLATMYKHRVVQAVKETLEKIK